MFTISRETHRDMILNPLKWPNLVLPLVRRSDHHRAAVFCPIDNKVSPAEPITIYLSNMFLDWRNAPTKTYGDVDALLDDGWVVD